MLKSLITAAVLITMFVSLLGARFAGDSEFIKELSLLNMTEHGFIVFVGTVMHKEYVTRTGIGITTDIIMRVDNLIKGTPNLSDDQVKFMIQGGRFYSTRTNRVVSKTVTGLPKFGIGEQALMFLALPEERDNNAYEHYTYNGLHVKYSQRGKKSIIDDKVFFSYLRAEDSAVSVKMSLDLSADMAKASIKDKCAAIQLEYEIKTLANGNNKGAIELPKVLEVRLLKESNRVIKKVP